MRRQLTIGTLGVAMVAVQAQTPSKTSIAGAATSKTSASPKTPWGDPDISGMWSTDECHEGNHALHNILSAARAEDKAVADALAKGLPPPKSTWLGGVAPGAPDQ